MNSGIPMNQVNGDYFDTFNTITAPAPQDVLQSAMDECDFYNNLLSKTVPGSDVWKLNHNHGEPMEVNDHTRNILEMALEMYRASEGAFNIAIGPAIALWHFTDGTAVLPDPEKIKEARRIAGMTQDQVSEKIMVSRVTFPIGRMGSRCPISSVL